MKSRFTISIPILVLLFASWAGAMTGDSTLYKDPTQKINVRIKNLMDQMTLEEKIGQMAQLDRVAATQEIMREYSIGSILSGGGSWPHERMTPEEWVDMLNNFQNGSLSSRLAIPMIYGIDA